MDVLEAMGPKHPNDIKTEIEAQSQRLQRVHQTIQCTFKFISQPHNIEYCIEHMQKETRYIL